ncbi:MAG: alpha/beta hydrolase [Acidimicrobiales bacterium]|nr:alpha/beta hydrolase [Acidimicrobiales bacterium]
MSTSWEAWRAASTIIGRGGVTVAAYDVGPVDGPPYTFLHGYPSASIDIAAVAARLPDHRMLAVDFPGFGASPKAPGMELSIHRAADAVEALWADRSVASTLVVAHDYGVSVAQELLARCAEGTQPVELTAVVWMNGGLYPDIHRPTLGQELLLDPEQGAALAAAMDEEMFAGGIAGTWGTRVPLDAEAVHAMWCSMDESGGAHLMHELLHYLADRRTHADRWRSALETSDLPIEFVWGDLDPVSGAHMIARVEERIPTAAVHRLPDVGHWPPLEAPDEVAAAIRRLC